MTKRNKTHNMTLGNMNAIADEIHKIGDAKRAAEVIANGEADALQSAIEEGKVEVISTEQFLAEGGEFPPEVVAAQDAALVAEHIEAEPIDPTEDTVGEPIEPEVEWTEEDQKFAAENPIEDGDGITLNDDGTLATNTNSPPDFSGEVLVPGASTQVAWDALVAETRQEVKPTPEKTWNEFTDEEREAALKANEPTGEVVEETVVNKTTEPEVDSDRAKKEAEVAALAMLADQETLQETKGEAPKDETESKKPKGAVFMKRWAAGTVKDGRPVKLGKDFAAMPDNIEIVVSRKDNPKRGMSEKRFNSILFKKAKTFGEYRKLWGAKTANEDLAWDTNHGFYTYRDPAEAPAAAEGSDTVAA